MAPVQTVSTNPQSHHPGEPAAPGHRTLVLLISLTGLAAFAQFSVMIPLDRLLTWGKGRHT
jgi:hypothetical protein